MGKREPRFSPGERRAVTAETKLALERLNQTVPLKVIAGLVGSSEKGLERAIAYNDPLGKPVVAALWLLADDPSKAERLAEFWRMCSQSAQTEGAAP